MSSRVENVINTARLNAGKSSPPVINIPPGTKSIQVVFDRRRFENNSSGDADICSIALFVDDVRNGGATWAGGIPAAEPRPGSRKLWSYARWPIPPNSALLRIEVDVPKQFSCLLHVDFF